MSPCGHRLSGEQRPARQDVYLGRLYRYRPRLMKVGVEDGKRQRVIERVVEGVECWNDPARNPFKLTNPNRQGFRWRSALITGQAKATFFDEVVN